MDRLLSASQWIYADGSLSWFTRWAVVSFFSAAADIEVASVIDGRGSRTLAVGL